MVRKEGKERASREEEEGGVFVPFAGGDPGECAGWGLGWAVVCSPAVSGTLRAGGPAAK